MTKEEAIQILSTRDAHGVLCGYTSGVTEAFDMAIESLSAEIVSIEDVREQINEAHNEGYDVGYWAGRRDYEKKWIPCSERLPKEDGRYQVTRHDDVTNTEFIDIL